MYEGSSYQKEDAVFALSAARILGMDIFSDAVKEAVRRSVWPGRFEKIRTNPDVIIDGSHNEEGIHALLQEIPKLKRPVIIVFTALADKRGKKMAEELCSAADTLIVTEFSHNRADTAEHLAPKGARLIPDYHEAVRSAIALGMHGTVLITGSLYFISLIRREFKNIT
jgi:dihydrofolate synthase/folylpolyglutamate synthase